MFHSDALSETDFMHSTNESENKDAECIFCNGKFSEDEEIEFSVTEDVFSFLIF